MKQKPTFKSLLISASIFSFFAFVFVNVHSSFNMQNNALNETFVQAQLTEDEDTADKKLAVPDVSILGRLWEITQKLLEH